MSLPFTLSSGQVAIYGMGTATSPSGITNIEASGDLRWGSIYQIWSGGGAYIYGGDNVMFRNGDIAYRVVDTNNIPYTIIQARLVTKQNPLL